MAPRVHPPGSQSSRERVTLALGRLRLAPRHASVSRYADRLADIEVLIDAHISLAGPGQGGSRQAYAINRAALIMLTGHFAGFVVDLFEEVWAGRYGAGSVPARLTDNFNNPWPTEIDTLYRALSHPKLTISVDPRSSKLALDHRGLIMPTQVREPKRRTDYQVRSVVAELVQIRNASAHGGSVLVRMRDVTNYLDDTVAMAVAMDAAV
jgi:hypothetical protein